MANCLFGLSLGGKPIFVWFGWIVAPVWFARAGLRPEAFTSCKPHAKPLTIHFDDHWQSTLESALPVRSPKQTPASHCSQETETAKNLRVLGSVAKMDTVAEAERKEIRKGGRVGGSEEGPSQEKASKHQVCRGQDANSTSPCFQFPLQWVTLR